MGKLRTEFTSPISNSTSPRLSDTTLFARWAKVKSIPALIKRWSRLIENIAGISNAEMRIATVEPPLTATSPQQPPLYQYMYSTLFWWAVYTCTLCFTSCLNLFRMATSLQQPLPSDPKVAIVEGFNCIRIIYTGHLVEHFYFCCLTVWLSVFIMNHYFKCTLYKFTCNVMKSLKNQHCTNLAFNLA